MMLRDLPVRYPLLTLLLSLLLLGALSPLLSRLWLTIDYKVYFDKDNPQLLAMGQMERTFIKDNTLLLVVAPQQGDVFAPEVLALIQQMTEQAWQIPHSLRVDSLTNYPFTEADGDSLVVVPWFEDAPAQQPGQLALRKTRALADVNVAGNLISKDGKVAVISITLEIPDNAVKEVPEVTSAGRAILTQTRASHPQITFHLGGSVMADQSFADAIAQDGQWLTPLSYLLIFGLIVVLLRSFAAMLITLVVIIGSVIIAFAIKTLFNSSINTATVVAPTVIMIVSVADSMHLFVTLFQQMRAGEDRLTALRSSLRINFQPIWLTSVTTAIGFACLNFNESPPLRDMGNTVAIGTLAAMLLSLTVLPALVALLPIKTPKPSLSHGRLMQRLAAFTLQQRKAILAISLIVAGLTLLGLPRNTLNESFPLYFDETFEFRQANDFMNSQGIGLHNINYTLDAGTADGLYDPAFLAKVDGFVQFLRAQPEVAHVYSFTEVLKQLNRNMHGDDKAFERLPEDRESAAQFTLLYELSLPYGQDLTNRISMDRSKTRVNMTIYLTNSSVILDLDQRAQNWLREHAPEMVSAGVSIDTLFANIAKSNIPSMVFGTLFALLLISSLILLATRSAYIGVISLLPNLLPLLMSFGLWGFLIGRIGLTESVITSLTMGLIVDDTVHFLTKFLRARRELNLDRASAVVYAYRTVGEAIVMTSIVFAAGFAVLAMSHFSGNSHMGLLTAITIGFAVLADLFFLPALLVLKEDKAAIEAAIKAARKASKIPPHASSQLATGEV